MPYVTPGRLLLLLLILAVLALTAFALAPVLAVQLAVRAALVSGGIAIVLALRPRAATHT